MLDFLVNNIDGIISSFTNLSSLSSSGFINGFNNLVFPAALALLLLIDTAFFSFGYIFESSYLGNRVKSVDPTFLGWFVALVCYPPLNSTFTKLTNWHSDDYAIFHSNKATFALRLVTIFLMAIYAYASVSLGSKASNLTNRGIVGSGAYKYVRHPAYISKNLVWWLTLLPVISFAAVLSMACWSFIYFMRAITEERHLSADPDYLAYCDKVKYRFIPGVF